VQELVGTGEVNPAPS